MRDIRLINAELQAGAPPGGAAWPYSAPPPRDERRWRLKRNCALRPGQYAGAIAGLMTVAAVVAIACWIKGLWLVPVFCAVELTAVGAAALAYARHAVDGEVVTLTADGRLLVELDHGTRRRKLEFAAARVRLVKDADNFLWLRQGERQIELGRQLSGIARDTFEAELRRALRV